jgi:hypothetical protein
MKWNEGNPPKDGSSIWVWAPYRTGIHLMRWVTPEESALSEGGSPDEYEGVWALVGQVWDNTTNVRWWVPFADIPGPSDE